MAAELLSVFRQEAPQPKIYTLGQYVRAGRVIFGGPSQCDLSFSFFITFYPWAHVSPFSGVTLIPPTERTGGGLGMCGWMDGWVGGWMEGWERVKKMVPK